MDGLRGDGSCGSGRNVKVNETARERTERRGESEEETRSQGERRARRMMDLTGDIRTEPDKEQTWLDCYRRAGSEPRGGCGQEERDFEGAPGDSHASSDHAPTFGRGGKRRRHRHDRRPGGKGGRARRSPAEVAGEGPVT